jgi:hypothetical protein
MRNGGKAFLITTCVATAACGVSTGGIAVRAIPDPAAKVRQGDATLGEARVQLALGNTGLALETFRKVIRTQGDSANALAGVAACYAAMGRYDIARENYEAALALAPHDPAVLRALADVLDPLGQRAEAAMARVEAARSEARPGSPAPSAPTAPAAAAARKSANAAPPVARLPTRPAAPVAAVAPAPPAATMSIVTVALPPVRPAAPQKAPIEAQTSTGSRSFAQAVPVAPLSPTITVELPPARPAKQLRDRDLASVLRDLVKVSKAKMLAAAPRSPQPRLERLSAGEVALVTTNAPIWRPQIVSRSRLSTTVRWVPIQLASRPNIRVLNAARTAGVAAHARGLLLDRGWRRIEIGDARQMRATSIVIYPANRRNIGRSLAAQFGFASMMASDGDVLMVLIGRDSAKRNVDRG